MDVQRRLLNPWLKKQPSTWVKLWTNTALSLNRSDVSSKSPGRRISRSRSCPRSRSLISRNTCYTRLFLTSSSYTWSCGWTRRKLWPVSASCPLISRTKLNFINDRSHKLTSTSPGGNMTLIFWVTCCRESLWWWRRILSATLKYKTILNKVAHLNMGS